MDRGFADRAAAGRAVAAALDNLRDRDDVVVLGLPRGGVPVAAEVATALHAPLDVLVVRKLGLPSQPELAMGAVAGVGDTVELVRNESVLAKSAVDDSSFDLVLRRETEELSRRRRAYLGDATPASVTGRIAVLVDDGLATGASMRAAIAAVRRQEPARVVVAVPVGSAETCAELRRVADEVVCVVTPSSFFAVGQAYADFHPTTDEEVRGALDRARLWHLLHRLGASDEEIRAAAQATLMGPLAVEVALRRGRPALSLREVAARLGRPVDELELLWQAFGLAAVDPDAGTVSAELADTWLFLLTMADLIGDEAALGLSRVIGAAAARLAEAVVDTFRMGFEVPQLESGKSYADVVQGYVDVARESLPALRDLVGSVLEAHLVRVAAGAWAPDVAGAVTRRELTVGFADLVGYTALVRTLAPAEVSRLLGGFEDAVGTVLARHGGRLVKLIGDGAMFVTDTPASACAAALELAESLGGSDAVPPVRVGLASGSVMGRYGDYFGDVVNLAARLVALAAPSTVVVSEDVADAAGPAYRCEALPPAALKGFGAPARVFRLARAERAG